MAIFGTKTNSRNRTQKISHIVGAGVLAFSLGFGSINTVLAEESNAIKVHGHWEVTIANPDGTVVREYEFENALTTSGKQILASMLYSSTFGPVDAADGNHYWGVSVDATGVDESEDACKYALRLYQDFNMDEVQATLTYIDSPPALTLTRTLALPISCVTGSDYSITAVDSAFHGMTRVGGTQGLLSGSFTAKTLPTPISGILPDQVVTLKVTISFG